jgi:FkbM family methyltransferase
MYSQNEEEKIIADYFTGLGTYLDIGANDGVTFSNTHALYINGWRGVNVEASPKAYERLVINRPDDVNIHAAAGPVNGRIVLNQSGSLINCNDVALVSSTKVEESSRWPGVEFEPVEVEMMDIPTIISRSGIKKIDLLSIDIEGMELEVLTFIPLIDLGIRMAIIEWNGKHRAEFDRIMKGYRVLSYNAENLIYIKRNTGSMLSI